MVGAPFPCLRIRLVSVKSLLWEPIQSNLQWFVLFSKIFHCRAVSGTPPLSRYAYVASLPGPFLPLHKKRLFPCVPAPCIAPGYEIHRFLPHLYITGTCPKGASLFSAVNIGNAYGLWALAGGSTSSDLSTGLSNQYLDLKMMYLTTVPWRKNK